MAKDDRRAKVTPETKEEARRLRGLWDTRSHPSQAEFGEVFGVGNQSAVGQFLRGDTPLSLKAARGFAQGLGVQIEDFSPRLAKEAAALADLVPAPRLAPEVAQIAAELNRLPKDQRDLVIRVMRAALPSNAKASSSDASRLTQADDDVSGRKDHARKASR